VDDEVSTSLDLRGVFRGPLCLCQGLNIVCAGAVCMLAVLALNPGVDHLLCLCSDSIVFRSLNSCVMEHQAVPTAPRRPTGQSFYGGRVG
jgi:hypothetical protein